MSHRFLGVGLLLVALAGCTELEGKECASDSDCEEAGGLCEPTVGLCYQRDDSEIDPKNCAPVCAAYEACTRAGCRPRFTALNILSPASNTVVGAAPVQMQAQLVVHPTYAEKTELPETLNFSAARDGGGDAGSFGTVTRNGSTYTVTWTPPATEGQIILTAAHPDPAAVLSAAVNVQVDTQAPTLILTFSNPPPRAAGAASQAEQRDPTPGYDVAFRRDESVLVTVTANEPVSNVLLTVAGIGLGGAPGQAQSPVAVQPGGTCTGSPAFCGSVTVDLSLPEMRDVRGTMTFRVEGTDTGGTQGTASAGLKVTRWKWAFDPGGGIKGTPAIGNRGNVYLGTSALGSGKAIAVGPDGARKWEYTTGDVLGSPAVGDYVSFSGEDGPDENVYVAAKSPASIPTFYALRGIRGTERHKCIYNGSNELPSAVAVGTTRGSGGDAETGVTINNSTPQVRIVELRPTGGLQGSGECADISAFTMPASVPGGAVVLQGQNVFYGTGDLKVTSYDLATGNNTPRTGWPQSTSYPARGLTLLDSVLYGGASDANIASQGGLFTVPTAGGSLSFIYPATPASRVFNLAIGSGDVAYFGAETSTTQELLSLKVKVAGTLPARTQGIGTLRGAPVVAKNDSLYTLNTQGQVAAWTASTLAQAWRVDLPTAPGDADGSPTLDCRRDASGQPIAGPGTLYVPAGSRLYALVIDSPGLDSSAPWPKFQHDARNTGNPATPITNCP